ncbi:MULTISPECIES: hypothetical protein [Rhodopseudomonas]|uniref:hypothetical protein n=1 Tax=Rhodopseudomonas TaxID=1073 RepID=UPI001F2248A5|nr:MULTISPECIES: hypothetical protein [Rhodopseudomonas]MDF3810681.1 hypothetical protein [Rhodopseudomonas sp. BAL398]WOK18473.1 hypothetical protein RBJ75_02785 [Rhodopseudomonas sp. BAL398]
MTVTDNAPIVGVIVSHAGFNSLTYAIQSGIVADTDAWFAVLLEHGDAPDMSDAVAVPDDNLLGTEALAGFTFADDAATRKLGYVGDKLYTRLTITPNANTGSAPVSAMGVLSHANTRPVA